MKKIPPAFLLIGIALVLLGMQGYLEFATNPYVLRIIVNCGIAAILAVSLNLINGCAGQFSLGHAGFMAVGAYLSATLTTLVPVEFFHNIWGAQLAIIFGGLLTALVGYLVALPSLRLRGDYLAIVTLGFGEMIRIILLNIEQIGGARGLPGIPSYANFFWVYLWVILSLLFIFRLMKSPYGRAIYSVREDEIAAEAMGVDIAQAKILAFTISSFFAGIAGGLFAHYQGFIDPNAFHFNRSVEIVIMIVIGGMGSYSGAILGAFLVTILPETLRIFEQYRLVIFPLILILLMLLRPQGIFGALEIWEVPWIRNLLKRVWLHGKKAV